MKSFFKAVSAIFVFLLALMALTKRVSEISKEKYVVLDQSGNEIY